MTEQERQVQDRRQAPYNNIPYQCVHESEIGQLRASYEGLSKMMENLVNKIDIMGGGIVNLNTRLPVMEEKHDQYVRDLARISSQIENSDNKHQARSENLELKLTNKIDNSFERVHSRIDGMQEKHNKLERFVYRAFWIGTGLWMMMLAIAYIVGDKPLKAVDKLLDNVSTLQRESEEFRSFKFGIEQQQKIQEYRERAKR